MFRIKTHTILLNYTIMPHYIVKNVKKKKYINIQNIARIEYKQ